MSLPSFTDAARNLHHVLDMWERQAALRHPRTRWPWVAAAIHEVHEGSTYAMTAREIAVIATERLVVLIGGPSGYVITSAHVRKALKRVEQWAGDPEVTRYVPPCWRYEQGPDEGDERRIMSETGWLSREDRKRETRERAARKRERARTLRRSRRRA